jgi:hypothetical protein
MATTRERYFQISPGWAGSQAVGQLALMNLPRYRHQALGDLTHLVLDPMMRDRISIARRGVEGQPPGEEDVAGIAIWASVSDAVDAKIAEQVKAGVFPVRLASEDWAIRWWDGWWMRKFSRSCAQRPTPDCATRPLPRRPTRPPEPLGREPGVQNMVERAVEGFVRPGTCWRRRPRCGTKAGAQERGASA